MEENKQVISSAKRNFNAFTAVAKKYVSNPITLVFMVLLLVLFIRSIILAISTDGASLHSWLFPDSGDYFMDFFNTMMDANRDDLYTNRWVIYPPLIEIFFRLITNVVPDGSTMTSFELRSYQSAIIVFVLIFAICFTVLGVLYFSEKKGTWFEKIAFVVITFVSLPFLSVIDRGNIIIMAVVFSALFVHLYKSEKALYREIAYICLAIGAAIKLYPAVLIMLLLKDKNWFGFLRCGIYCAILFFVPFLYFGNVTENIQAYFRNIFGWSSSVASVSDGLAATVSYIKGRGAQLLSDFDEIVSISGKVDKISGTLSYTGTLQILVAFISGDYATLAGCKALSNVILIFAFISGFFVKDWKGIALWSLMSLTMFSGTYTYSLCFMAIPCIRFLNDADFKNPLHWIYMLCFVGIFGVFSTEFTYWNCGLTGYSIRLGEFMARVSILVMTMLLIWEGLYNIMLRIYKNTMLFITNREKFNENLEENFKIIKLFKKQK